jgi:hypothetical protein
MRVLLAALVFLVAAPAAGEEVLVDAVLVVVENTPIAASRVAFEKELRKKIAGPDCAQSFGRLLCAGGEPLEALIFREILRLSGVARDVEVSSAEARTRQEAFRVLFGAREGADQFLALWRITEQDLLEFFRETAVLDQAIEVTVGRLVRDIPEEEERRYHADNADSIFAGRAYEDVAALVSRQYYAFKFERTYDAWASELRSGARIRYIGRAGAR